MIGEKILILAQSGFGKTTSIGNVPELGIKGLNPEETFLITATSKPLPFKSKGYKICDSEKAPDIDNGNRFITNNGQLAAQAINYVNKNRPDIKNIVIDDSNYFIQDYYMENSLKKGYDTFKEIGYMMHKIFDAMEKVIDKNVILLAHAEEFKDSNFETISYRFKTVGKLVADQITPEGKFTFVLFGKQYIDADSKKIIKKFVTNYDGQYPAKAPAGIFQELYIPNDLGYVLDKIKEFRKND